MRVLEIQKSMRALEPTGQVGVAYATSKAAFSRKEQSFEAGVGVAALRGNTLCIERWGESHFNGTRKCR